ncbi:hypothetical protein HAX54_047487 [Datura stramonium]|uniref:Uncharacterized protein n=1 Tax=Datura stramonium TaxID=4076 RepID=A0ABS8WM31_DATST|nr:hypothetical protein [Datura stramonium]
MTNHNFSNAFHEHDGHDVIGDDFKTDQNKFSDKPSRLDDVEFSMMNDSQLVALETGFHDLVTSEKEARNRKLDKYNRSPWDLNFK